MLQEPINNLPLTSISQHPEPDSNRTTSAPTPPVTAANKEHESRRTQFRTPRRQSENSTKQQFPSILPASSSHQLLASNYIITSTAWPLILLMPVVRPLFRSRDEARWPSASYLYFLPRSLAAKDTIRGIQTKGNSTCHKEAKFTFDDYQGWCLADGGRRKGILGTGRVRIQGRVDEGGVRVVAAGGWFLCYIASWF